VGAGRHIYRPRGGVLEYAVTAPNDTEVIVVDRNPSGPAQRNQARLPSGLAACQSLACGETANLETNIAPSRALRGHLQHATRSIGLVRPDQKWTHCASLRPATAAASWSVSRPNSA